MLKTIRAIPLKAHFYAALTADISRKRFELAQQLFEGIITTLQDDICSGAFPQALNSLNFLSEAMNVLLFNSLALVDLLADLLAALESQNDPLRQCLL